MTPEEAIAHAGAEDHWHRFAEFVYYERAVGGPDPHMRLVGEGMSAGEDWREIVWRGGCYIGVYNVPTAQVLWEHLRPEEAVDYDKAAAFVADAWGGLTMRRERRAVRTPTKLAKYLCTYAQWMEELADQPWATTTNDYAAAWRDVHRVYGLGRYVALKLIEYLGRYAGSPTRLEGIMAKGGWSPRQALALLYPNGAHSLMGDDSPHNVQHAEHVARLGRDRLAESYGIDLDWYNFQVLLCDYKQSYVGKRQFPGRSQDSELEYWRKIDAWWGLDRKMFEARARLFPLEALGEHNGWVSVREELGNVLRDFKYTWSDLLYDYDSTVDLRKPVQRPEPLIRRLETLAGVG